jgi:Flp pilus assembly protein TadG
LVIPLLLLLVFGIIEFGIIFNTKLVISSAAREGARKAAITSVENDVGTVIANAVASLNATTVSHNESANTGTGLPNDKTIWWDIETDPASRVTGGRVEVYVIGRVDIVIPIISNIIGPSVKIPAKAVMRIESN